MKVSLSWLKELVDYQLSADQLAEKLSLSSLGVKQQTEDYLELDLTYNRGDLLSMRGVAYEVSAITEAPLRFLAQTPEDFIWVGQNLPKTPVEIESDELASVQCVAKIENLTFKDSPKEWTKKLTDCGMRSVNNIADITNLVMLEYGQPLHAFDASSVKDKTINVRRAKQDEEITTLDQKTRKLSLNDIVLADTEKPLDVAGVMGGKDTEVKESTTTILLSASLFNPLMVRKTAKRLGLHSEASRRFQHGLSKIRLLQALDAAIRMYHKIGGTLTGLTLVGDFNQEKRIVNLSIKKVNSLLGLKLDEETITSCLKKLNFNFKKAREDILEVIPPYFRLDINIEEDLIEEVARMYGYEKIEGSPLEDDSPIHLDQSLPKSIYDLKLKLTEQGLTEVQTYSFYSTAVLEALQFTKEGKEDLIRIANPISSETEYMRMDLWPNLLEVVGKNIKKGYKDIGIFEIGKTYKQENGQPKEEYRLSIALMNGNNNPIEELMQIRSHLRGEAKLSPGSHLGGELKPNPTLFHPKRVADGIGEVHLRLLNKLGIEKRVAVMEIDLINLISN